MYTLAASGARVFADENRNEKPSRRFEFLKQLWQWELFFVALDCADPEPEMPKTVGAGKIEELLRMDLMTHQVYKRERPYLLIFDGHSFPNGWARAPTYRKLAKVLKEELAPRQKVIIINDTCFGFNFSKHLEREGLKSQVSLLCSHDAREESWGGIGSETLQAWIQRKKPEEKFGATLHIISDEGTHEVEYVLRWGPTLDKYWFLPTGRKRRRRPFVTVGGACVFESEVRTY